MAIPVLLHFLFSSFHTMMADLSAESITARKHSALIGWDREVDTATLGRCLWWGPYILVNVYYL